jgi:hypothetical protein
MAWIHWVFSTKGDSTDARLVLGGTGSGTYEPGEPLNAEVWHFYTPFFELEGLEATIYLFGGDPGPGGGLVISDYCPGFEELTVTKTAETSLSPRAFVGHCQARRDRERAHPQRLPQDLAGWAWGRGRRDRDLDHRLSPMKAMSTVALTSLAMITIENTGRWQL